MYWPPDDISNSFQNKSPFCIRNHSNCSLYYKTSQFLRLCFKFWQWGFGVFFTDGVFKAWGKFDLFSNVFFYHANLKIRSFAPTFDPQSFKPHTELEQQHCVLILSLAFAFCKDDIKGNLTRFPELTLHTSHIHSLSLCHPPQNK